MSLINLEKENLHPKMKLSVKRSDEFAGINLATLSCWIWIYRSNIKSLKNPKNRLECRWFYENEKGSGVFSWRLDEVFVTPNKKGVHSLDFQIDGESVGALNALLKKNKMSFTTSQDHLPSLSCEYDSNKCDFTFAPKEVEEVKVDIGQASTIFSNILIEDHEIKNKLHYSKDFKGPFVAANCFFEGQVPARGHFIIQSNKNRLFCVGKNDETKEISLELDMSATTNRKWGSKLQGYQALTVMGPISKQLFYALRKLEETNSSELIQNRDLVMLNEFYVTSLIYKLDKTEFPKSSLECSHKIWHDSYSQMFLKRHPKTYLGRMEYYSCLLRGWAQ